MTPVRRLSTNFSPIPTPTRFRPGSGLMADVRAREAGMEGRPIKRLDHSCLAARMPARLGAAVPGPGALRAGRFFGIFEFFAIIVNL